MEYNLPSELVKDLAFGEDVIDGPNGRWPEGDKNHPWEAEAIQAEKSPLKNYKKGYYGVEKSKK